LFHDAREKGEAGYIRESGNMHLARDLNMEKQGRVRLQEQEQEFASVHNSELQRAATKFQLLRKAGLIHSYLEASSNLS
jgi:hypothetical protein